MKKNVRAIGLVLVFAMLMSAVVCFAACKGRDDKDKTTVAPSITPNLRPNGGNNNQNGNNAHKVPTPGNQGDKVNTGIPENWGIKSEETLVTVVYGGVEYPLNASKLFAMDRTEAGIPFNDSNKGIGNYNGVRIKDLLAALEVDIENVKFNDIVLYHPDGSSESLGADMAQVSPYECVVSPYKNHIPAEPQNGVSFVVVYLDKNTQIKEFSGVVKIEIK